MRKKKTLDGLLQEFCDRLESGDYTAREAMACQPIIDKITTMGDSFQQTFEK